MANMIVGLEPVAAPTSRRGKGRLLVRTVKRRLAKKALHFVNALLAMDLKDSVAGAERGYNPYLVTDNVNSANQKAFLKIAKRLSDSLAARE